MSSPETVLPDIDLCSMNPTKLAEGGTLSSPASLRPFFHPRSVAVVGASRDQASIGYRLLDAIRGYSFRGKIYLVNPKVTEIVGLRTFPSVRDLPEPVDLAVIAVPRDAVLPVVDDCARRGVKALIVISAGFAEAGGVGRVLQEQLKDKVRRYGLRLIGPNCLGLVTTHPEVQLNATFIPGIPPRGTVAMSSDSGALGLALLATAARLDLGISSCVSIGNRADVSSNDLLEYWENEEDTQVILLYLESFGNARRFAQIARRVSRTKPVVAVAGGRTRAGQRAAGSHTAALAGSTVAVDALFRQAGIIRANTLEEMFDLAAALSHQPLPRGRRVGILTNAGGPAILCADMCEGQGLTLPEFSGPTRAKLSAFLTAAGGLANPVDMVASAGPEEFRQAIKVLLSSGEIDALIVIHVVASPARSEAISQAIAESVAAARPISPASLPVLTCIMPELGSHSLAIPTGEKIPCYPFPEEPARVLGKMADHAAWRSQQAAGTFPHFADSRSASVRELCCRVLALRGPGWLTTEEARALLKEAGLPIQPGKVVTTAEEAEAAAARLGFPVAVKLASPRILHKTEMGGVHLHLCNTAEVRQAFQQIQDRLVKEGKRADMEGVLVQPMVSGGTEVMVGMTQDLLFGPLIAFGLGGIHVEILGDVCFRMSPLTDRDAREMVRSIRGYRLLEGYRGHPRADIAALEELLLRLSQLVEEVPEITELDLNPVFALAPDEGCRIVDARIHVGNEGALTPANTLDGQSQVTSPEKFGV